MLNSTRIYMCIGTWCVRLKHAINHTLILPYDVCIVYEHWSETREFITQNVELWNRWIRLLCYYNTV